MQAAERVAAALVPLLVSERGVERLAARRRLVVWSAGVGRALEEASGGLLERRWYRNRSYERSVLVVPQWLWAQVKQILADPHRLRRAVRHHKETVVRAFRLYTPRGIGGNYKRLRRHLIQLLGHRTGGWLYKLLKKRLPRTILWVRLATSYRRWGYVSRLKGCTKEITEEYSVHPWTAERACERRLRRDPWWYEELPRRTENWW